MEDVYKAIQKGKKRPDDLDKDEQGAMMSVLKDIHKMASDDMGHDIHGMKKVSVASDTVNGLKAGLDKAKGMVQDHKHRPFGNEEADSVSDDMHPESQRHKLAKHSEMDDQEDAMADAHGDADEEKGMAKGGKVGSYNGMPKKGHEDDAEDLGHGQKNGMAGGGKVAHQEDNRWGDPHADAGFEPSDVEHQVLQSKGMNTKYAMPTIKKEKDTSAPPAGSAAVMASGGMIKGSIGQGTHGVHGSPDPADEYSDLDPEEIEALIAHLMKQRKPGSSF